MGLLSISSCFFLLASSASLNGLVENSGKTVEVNAISLPSGDQTPEFASVLREVSCFASPPSRPMTHSCHEPERFDSNSRCLPLGLQRGWRSRLAGGLVSCFGSPFAGGASTRDEGV